MGLVSFDWIDIRGTRHILWAVIDTTNHIESGQTWPDTVRLRRLVSGTKYDVSVWQWLGRETGQVKLGNAIFVR
jgi:hypothetical protein